MLIQSQFTSHSNHLGVSHESIGKVLRRDKVAIPVYIVKDADCIGHSKDRSESDDDQSPQAIMESDHEYESSPVYKYFAMHDEEEVLLV